MKTVFADTGYWIALLDPQDTLHTKALNCSHDLASCQIVTTEMVFTEVLNHFAKRGRFLRAATVALVQRAGENPAIAVLELKADHFRQGLSLYQQRLDQAWSLTDCVSFCIMKQRGILESLAYDKHFEQAGFVALLRN